MLSRFIFFAVFVFIAVGCAKQWSNNEIKPEKLPKLKPKEFIAKLDSISLSAPHYMYTKLKVNYKGADNKGSFKTTLKSVQDSAVSAVVSFARIPVFSVLIDSSKLTIVNKKDKCFSEQSISEFSKKAGVDFAILGTEEQCNGDVARRTGNEYLADSMVQMNIETMNQYKFNRIVATCPHCFNTLKNEFPQFGGKYEVIHHTQYIMELVKEGKLKFADTKAYDSIAYHDSCYMGRYNDVYEEPRNSLKSVPGMNVIDPKRSRDKGLCCGAGGGQMFMEENQGKRVNIERTEELISTGAKTIAVNCPFCMTMISDGVKMKDADDVQVKDVSEILLESMENGDGK